METFFSNEDATPADALPPQDKQTKEEILEKAIVGAIYWIREEASPWDALRLLEDARKRTR